MLTHNNRGSFMFTTHHHAAETRRRVATFIDLADQFEQLEQRSLMTVLNLLPGLIAPTEVTVTVAPTSLRLNWLSAGTRATGFNILRSVDGGAFAQLGRTAGSAVRTFTDATAETNRTYRYTIQAFSTTNMSTQTFSTSVLTPLVMPSQVTTTILSSSAVNLTWRGNDANGTGFLIVRSTDGRTFTFLTKINNSNATSYTDSTVTTGVAFSYQVRSIVGFEPVTNASAATAPVRAAIALANPTAISATAAATSTSISWSGIDPRAINAVVQRSTAGGVYRTIATLARTATAYTDTALVTGSNYAYRVLATNAVVAAGTSAVASVTTLLSVPRDVRATASGSTVVISWLDSNRAGISFQIMRSEDGTSYTDIATVAGAGRSYTDSTGTAGQLYYYRVRAAAESLNSAASRAVSAASATSAASETEPVGTSNVTITTRYGSELLITSLAGADNIWVGQSGSNFSIVINGQTFTHAVTSSGLFIYDRGGGDTITIDSSVTARTVVSAIAYGSSTIVSDATNSSIWVDRTDIVSGVGNTHVVTALAGGVSLDPGVSLANPTDSGATVKVEKSLFGAGPSATDINQGSIGDCYFLASLAAFATSNPAVVQEAAVDLGDGTYIVEFKRPTGEKVFTRVSNAMAAGGFGGVKFAHSGSNNTMWAMVMEKAYCSFRTGANTYASISGGWMGAVYTAFGQGSGYIGMNSSESSFFTSISTSLANRIAVTFGTISAPSMLVGGHAYTLISATRDSNGIARYIVRNPWGVSGRAAEDSGGYATLTFAQMQSNFSAGARAAA